MDARPGALVRWRRGYAAASAAVGFGIVLAVARADYLVGATTGKACGGIWDTVRWSLLVKACNLSEVDHFDVANGEIVVLATLAALNPTLLVLRLALLVPVLMYLGGASRMHTQLVATGYAYHGNELWWLPIFWLSTMILVTAIFVAAFKWTKRR